MWHKLLFLQCKPLNEAFLLTRYSTVKLMLVLIFSVVLCKNASRVRAYYSYSSALKSQFVMHIDDFVRTYSLTAFLKARWHEHANYRVIQSNRNDFWGTPCNKFKCFNKVNSPNTFMFLILIFKRGFCAHCGCLLPSYMYSVAFIMRS